MAKKSSFLSMTLTLTLICLVCSALLGFVYSFTEKPIKNAEVAKKNSAISVVLPQFTNVPSEEEQTLEMDGKEYKVVIDEFLFIVELDFLKGAERLEKIAPVKSLIHL